MPRRPDQESPGWARWLATQRRKLTAGELTLVDDDTPTVYGLRQMRESDFLTVLAVRLAQDVPARSMARSRLLPFEPFEAFLFNIRDAVIGRGNVQAWINRGFFDVPAAAADRPFNGAEAIERMAAQYRLATRLSEAAQAGPGAAGPLGPPAPVVDLAALQCPPPPADLDVGRQIRNTPTRGLPSTTIYGQLVHQRLQELYRWTHPGHCVLTEANLSGPCTAQEGGTLRPDARLHHNLDVKVWAMALATGLTSQVRVDIADLTTKEVWEIKSRAEVVDGVYELYGTYLCWVNDTIAKVNAAARAAPGGTAMRLYRPGRSWIPLPVFLVTPTVLAWVHAELPGILYYDLFAAPPFFVPHYAEEYREQEARARRRSAQRSAEEDGFSWWWLPVGAAVAVLAVAALPVEAVAAVGAAGVALIVADDDDGGGG